MPKNKSVNSLEELDALRVECKKMVTRRAGLSAAAAVVPILGADIGADVGLLLEMIPAINRKFGLTPEQIDDLDPQVRKVTLIAVSSIGSEMVGRMVTKQIIMRALQAIGGRMATKGVAKLVPVLGQAVAATISFGAMKMVGDAHVDDCYVVAREALLALEHPPRRRATDSAGKEQTATAPAQDPAPIHNKKPRRKAPADMPATLSEPSKA